MSSKRLLEEGEAGLGRRLADERLDVGIHSLVAAEVALDVTVEPGEVHLLLGEDRGAELDHAQDDVVDEPELLRPVPEGERAELLVRQRLVLDAEEALEGLEPHLQLEELGRAPRLGDALRPLPELAPQEVGALDTEAGRFFAFRGGHRSEDYSDRDAGRAVIGACPLLGGCEGAHSFGVPR